MPKKLAQTRVKLRYPALVGLITATTGLSCLAQTSATVANTPAEVDAGDAFTVKLTFDIPSTCTRQVYMPIGSLDTGYAYLVGEVKAGENTVSLTYLFPKDYKGKFATNDPSYIKPYLVGCPGYSRSTPFSAPTITVNVNPVPDTNTYPKLAGIVLSLTQKQFLNTKISALKELATEIDTRVDADGNDTVGLRNFLEGIVQEAETQLLVTEREYKSQLLKDDEALPVFFADFDKQYADLLTELRRTPASSIHANSASRVQLLYVQQPLKQRKPSDSPIRSNNLSGTAPAIAKAVESTLSNNASAYKAAQTQATGHPTFHARFESYPTGATLYYRQAIVPEFSVWSSPTNISGADFPLATFIFKFHKEGCEDEPVYTAHPYEDTNPDVSVEFRRCKTR